MGSHGIRSLLGGLPPNQTLERTGHLSRGLQVAALAGVPAERRQVVYEGVPRLLPIRATRRPVLLNIAACVPHKDT